MVVTIRLLLASLGVALPALVPLSAQAQPVSRPVVQEVPRQDGADLARALRRLATAPDDLNALLEAAYASINLGDYDGALRFFSRAQAMAPGDRRILLGQAVMAVRREDPFTAIGLFDRAAAAGANVAPYAAERALAYDLVGENVTAQLFYRQALSLEDDPVVRRQLALSEVIGGDLGAAEATLLPLLQRGDRPAFRTRAFMLAIAGRHDEASAIMQGVLPLETARRLEPYLRQMPRLTRAQQAAAANLGHFPQPDQIGVDTPQVAALEGARPTPVRSAAGPRPATMRPDPGARLVPQGEAMGPVATAAPAPAPAPSPASVSEPVTQPITQAAFVPDAAEPASELVANELPASSAPVERAAEETDAGQVPVRVAAVDPSAPAEPSAVEPIARPSIDLGVPDRPGLVPTAATEPAEAAPELVTTREEPASVAEAFGDFAIASPAPRRGPADAVDITTIEPPREREEEPEAQAEVPASPTHPARHWVQVATGRDREALAFDWRRFGRMAPELLSEREGYLVEWGETNRLVTGPFPDVRAARAFVEQLREEDISSFAWDSDAGEAVDPLP